MQERLQTALFAERRAVRVRDLLDTRQLAVENRVAVARALASFGAGDLADGLIVEVAREVGCLRVVTFDRKAAKVGMELLAY